MKDRRVQARLQQTALAGSKSPFGSASSSRRPILLPLPEEVIAEEGGGGSARSAQRTLSDRTSSAMSERERERGKREATKVREEREREQETRMRAAGLTESQQRQLIRMEIDRRWNKRVLGIWRYDFPVPPQCAQSKGFREFRRLLKCLMEDMISVCEPLAEGLETRVESAPSLSCTDEVYIRWSGIAAAAMVLLGVVIPLFLGVALMRELRRLRLEINRPLRANFRRRFGFLIQGFRPGFEYWELTIIIRKLLLQLCLAFYLGESANMRLSQAVWLAIFSFLIQCRESPFNSQDNDVLNKLEAQALASWLLSLVLFQMLMMETMTQLQNLAVIGGILALNGFFLFRIIGVILSGYVADVGAMIREVEASSDPSLVLPGAIVRVPFLLLKPILKFALRPIESLVDSLVSKDTLKLVDNGDAERVDGSGGALTEGSFSISSFCLARCGKVFEKIRPISKEQLLDTLIEIDSAVSHILVKWDTEIASDRKKGVAALARGVTTSFRSLGTSSHRALSFNASKSKASSRLLGEPQERSKRNSTGRSGTSEERWKRFQPPEFFDEFLFRWAVVCSQRIAEDEELALSAESVNDLDELLWIAQRLLRPPVSARDDHPFVEDLKDDLSEPEQKGEGFVPATARERRLSLVRERRHSLATVGGDRNDQFNGNRSRRGSASLRQAGGESEEDEEDEDETSPVMGSARQRESRGAPVSLLVRDQKAPLEGKNQSALSKRRDAFDIAGERWDPLCRDTLTVGASTWAERRVRSVPEEAFHLMTPKSFRAAAGKRKNELSPAQKGDEMQVSETGEKSIGEEGSPVSPEEGKRFRSFRLDVYEKAGMKKKGKKGRKRGKKGTAGPSPDFPSKTSSFFQRLRGKAPWSSRDPAAGNSVEKIGSCFEESVEASSGQNVFGYVVPQRLRESGFPLRPSQLQKVGEAFFSFGQNGALLDYPANLDDVLRALRTFLHMHPTVVLWHYLCFLGAKRRILDRAGMGLVARWLRYIRTDVARPATNPPMPGLSPQPSSLPPAQEKETDKDSNGIRERESSDSSLGSGISDLHLDVWKSAIHRSLVVARDQAKQKGVRPNHRFVEKVEVLQRDSLGLRGSEVKGSRNERRERTEHLLCDFAFVELPLSDHFGVTHPSGDPEFEIDSVHGRALECWLPLAEGRPLSEEPPNVSLSLGLLEESELGEEAEWREEGRGDTGEMEEDEEAEEAEGQKRMSASEEEDEQSPLLVQNLPPAFFSGDGDVADATYRNAVRAGKEDNLPLSAPHHPIDDLHALLHQTFSEEDQSRSDSGSHSEEDERSPLRLRESRREDQTERREEGSGEAQTGTGTAALSAMEVYESVALGARSRLPVFRSVKQTSSRPFGLREEAERVRRGEQTIHVEAQDESEEIDSEEEEEPSDISEVTPLKRRGQSQRNLRR
uniref:Transmembrane protein n=1 Tax=Chromera velia CCMP2878 TaxID=1169474 RepID=A0A0G4HQN6_9ALVE|eukprot:Cvel_7959.t1-p1 / transcript=Cvel_7959.t1 / gene=Cvel_7959 / organism=Chromera_velia_CCMP2878 / gene_product=hypothetical protein / transcript_product=hypothetical protein / location=Cvel_scaffold428:48945-57277(+) / protein_length=1416 / sequence_SO=supercontig / SO=protein_coding / is_pseudo=false